MRQKEQEKAGFFKKIKQAGDVVVETKNLVETTGKHVKSLVVITGGVLITTTVVNVLSIKAICKITGMKLPKLMIKVVK